MLTFIQTRFGHLSSIPKLTLIEEIVAFFDTAVLRTSINPSNDIGLDRNFSPDLSELLKAYRFFSVFSICVIEKN